MRCSLIALLTAQVLYMGLPATAQDKPLTEFPYTPGLDTSALDTTANPCEDFYQYSCGGWMQNNPIPADQSNWSVYGKLYQDNQRFLWGILETLSHNGKEWPPPTQQQHWRLLCRVHG
ncbi:hypothetical protein [Candidatus Aalborgicola defluviihabitans]|uniref:hypothetical protein n=1 Tax=Candidatus Aalborgicola defluviihabitans TaxID=3386187 RepID=UPI001ED6901F|nr:hypothetical protein [Burkholderiales bacterium]